MGSTADLGGVDLSEGGKKAVVEFTATRNSVMENEERIRIGIRRYGKMNNQVMVKYVLQIRFYIIIALFSQ